MRKFNSIVEGNSEDENVGNLAYHNYSDIMLMTFPYL